jgi:hypothetical protein
MAGNVYVFNVASEDLQLVINGQAAGGRIAGWSGGQDRYRPNGCAVPRNRNPQGGTFGNGPNQVILDRPGSQSTAQVAIDGARIPIGQDLLLFVARNQWQLVGDFGDVLASGPVRNGFDPA